MASIYSVYQTQKPKKVKNGQRKRPVQELQKHRNDLERGLEQMKRMTVDEDGSVAKPSSPKQNNENVKIDIKLSEEVNDLSPLT